MEAHSKKLTSSPKASTNNAKDDTGPNDFSRAHVFHPPGNHFIMRDFGKGINKISLLSEHLHPRLKT
ncbi:hypothetical protein CDAR_575081 [Caerostris darwini]|uniref:Uncharacterized protein n=1 Tax=Caerostris darwini TaxID=1538125 RepID=A0AAV4SXS6_9ARAC|nr:hypothetical protein CDAR_575081 [Caerostris darwini]